MIPAAVRIFVCTEPVDMRQGFDRLMLAARDRTQADPQQGGALFVFANRGATRIKVLWFEGHFVSLIASCRMLGLEPYAYLRDLLCLLPGWPRHRLLELAPAYWNKTLEQSDAQQRLDANVFRRVSLGLSVS